MSYPPKKSGTRLIAGAGYRLLPSIRNSNSRFACANSNPKPSSGLSGNKKNGQHCYPPINISNRNLPFGLLNMNTYKPNRHRVRADTLLFVEYKNVLHLRTYVLYHSLSAVSTTSRHLFIIFQKRSSRLALYRASPSTEPDVRLSRIRLPAKFILQQLSFIDFHIYSRLRQWAGFQHLVKALPVVAFLLASSVQPVVQALPYLKAKI